MNVTEENPIVSYKMTGQSDMLVEKYRKFLDKYHSMIVTGIVDFSNYDLRHFLSLYISNKRISSALRSGKHPTSEIVSEASRVLHIIKSKLKGYDKNEIFHELLIPFLKKALKYKEIGAGFQRYLYHSYRFELKRHLDCMPNDLFNHEGILHLEALIEQPEETVREDELIIEMDEKFKLSHPQWIHGNKAKEPFSSFKPHERYILVKYYDEEKSDKEIARMLPYSPKSIHRIRMRCIKQIIELESKGELKCLRFVKSQLLQ